MEKCNGRFSFILHLSYDVVDEPKALMSEGLISNSISESKRGSDIT